MMVFGLVLWLSYLFITRWNFSSPLCDLIIPGSCFHPSWDENSSSGVRYYENKLRKEDYWNCKLDILIFFRFLFIVILFLVYISVFWWLSYIFLLCTCLVIVAPWILVRGWLKSEIYPLSKKQDVQSAHLRG